MLPTRSAFRWHLDSAINHGSVRTALSDHVKFKPFLGKPNDKYEEKWAMSMSKIRQVSYMDRILSKDLKQIHVKAAFNVAVKKQQLEAAADILDFDSIQDAFVGQQGAIEFYVRGVERIFVELSDKATDIEDVLEAEGRFIPILTKLKNLPCPPNLINEGLYQALEVLYTGHQQGDGDLWTIKGVVEATTSKRQADIWKVILPHSATAIFIGRLVDAQTREDNRSSRGSIISQLTNKAIDLKQALLNQVEANSGASDLKQLLCSRKADFQAILKVSDAIFARNLDLEDSEVD